MSHGAWTVSAQAVERFGFHEATAPEAPFRAGRTRLRRAAGRSRYNKAFPGKGESGVSAAISSRVLIARPSASRPCGRTMGASFVRGCTRFAPGSVHQVDRLAHMREGAAGESRMLDRIRSILLARRLEGPVIALEKRAAWALFLRYVRILAFIPAPERFSPPCVCRCHPADRCH